jgi:hypothetical protein
MEMRMAQDRSNDSSNALNLPVPANGPSDAGGSASAHEVVIAPAVPVADNTSRDLLVGGGILLVLFIAFFFVKTAYANTLVGNKVPPAKANAAGWWLWVFLASATMGTMLAVVNPARFLTPIVVGPIGAVAVLALLVMFLTGRK